MDSYVRRISQSDCEIRNYGKKISTEYNKRTEQVKNPNWEEADQYAMDKCSRGVEQETTWLKSR